MVCFSFPNPVICQAQLMEGWYKRGLAIPLRVQCLATDVKLYFDNL